MYHQGGGIYLDAYTETELDIIRVVWIGPHSAPLRVLQITFLNWWPQ